MSATGGNGSPAMVRRNVQHLRQGLEPRGIGPDHGIGAVAEGLGGGERCLLAGDVVIETALGPADELPAVGHTQGALVADASFMR